MFGNKHFNILYFLNFFRKRPLKAPYTYPIPNPESDGRRFAITDIHGCYLTFRALLDKIQLHPKDQLFLLGDYIHKGPNSKLVLDDIMHLQAQAYQVYALRGNHEEIFLNCAYGRPRELAALTEKYNTQNLLENPFKVLPKYLNFLNKLPYYFELADCFLVHAGLNFQSRKPLKDKHAMLYIRDYEADLEFLKHKRIIHGHNPKMLSIIQNHLHSNSPIVPLDNGCVYYGERPGHGNLLCLNLDNFELIIQENIENRDEG